MVNCILSSSHDHFTSTYTIWLPIIPVIDLFSGCVLPFSTSDLFCSFYVILVVNIS